MSIGMTYDEYWYSTPFLVKTYYKCHKLQIEEKNQEMWMQGLYFLNALQSVASAVYGKKESKPVQYPKEPINIFHIEKSEYEKEREAEKERDKAIASFMNLQSAMQRKFSTKEEKQ